MTSRRPEPRIETRTYKLADGRVTTTYSLRYYRRGGQPKAEDLRDP